MEKSDLLRLMGSKVSKYGPAVLAVALGILFIAGDRLWTKKETPAETEEPEAETFSLELQEERLCEILGSIEGVGRVRVRLETAETEELVPAVNEKRGTAGDETTTVVTIPRGSGRQEALIIRTRYPEYTGCVVVCQGADSDRVRLTVTQAVCALTGLGSDRVTVAKMK